MKLDIKTLAKCIDHTALKPNADEKQIIKLCDEAIEWGFASVCVNPYFVNLAASILRYESPKICTVIGFPLGANKMQTKVAEADDAMCDGASEIDMVANISAFLSDRYETVAKEIQTISEIAHLNGSIVKVIIETCLLSDKQKKEICKIAMEAGADFVKTSTGFSTGGATIDDIKLMRSVVGDRMQVKASGGIRNLDFALELIEAGADRIGASASVEMMKAALNR